MTLGTLPTFIFIDLPNVIYRTQDGQAKPFSLRALFEHIQQHAIPEGAEHSAIMYWFKYGRRHLALTPAQTKFNEITDAILGIEVSINNRPVQMFAAERFKDVDVYMVNGIWRSVAGALVRDHAHIRHVIVSGDSDYANTYRQIRKEVGDRLEIELYQYAWRQGSSPEFRRLAAVQTHLQDIAGISNPVKT